MFEKILVQNKREFCSESKGEGNALGRERCKKGNRSHNVWEMKLIVFLNSCLLKLPINIFDPKFLNIFNIYFTFKRGEFLTSKRLNWIDSLILSYL